MYDDSGSVLGAATSAIVLPATVSILTGINYFLLLVSFAAFLVLYNLLIKTLTKRA